MNNSSKKQRQSLAEKLLAHDSLPDSIITKQQKEIEKMVQKRPERITKILWGIAAFWCVYIGWGYLYVSTGLPGQQAPLLSGGIVLIIIGFICGINTSRTEYGIRFPSVLMLLILAFISVYLIFVITDIVPDQQDWFLSILVAGLFVFLFGITPFIFWFIKNSVNQILKEIKELRLEVAELRESTQKEEVVS